MVAKHRETFRCSNNMLQTGNNTAVRCVRKGANRAWKANCTPAISHFSHTATRHVRVAVLMMYIQLQNDVVMIPFVSIYLALIFIVFASACASECSRRGWRMKIKDPSRMQCRKRICASAGLSKVALSSVLNRRIAHVVFETSKQIQNEYCLIPHSRSV